MLPQQSKKRCIVSSQTLAVENWLLKHKPSKCLSSTHSGSILQFHLPRHKHVSAIGPEAGLYSKHLFLLAVSICHVVDGAINPDKMFNTGDHLS